MRALPILLLVATAALAKAPDPSWAIPGNSYRVRLKLDHPISTHTAIEVDPQAIIDSIAKVSVDQLNHETFAFEKAVLVDPRTGKTVGRFQLVRTGEPLDIDGSFTQLAEGDSPWQGYANDKMSLQTIDIGGKPRQALLIKEDQVFNAKIHQPVRLTRNQSYLLQYWIMMDAQDNEMGVMLNDPSKELFAQLPHSYFNKMPPRGEWGRRQLIIRPQIEDAQLEVRPESMDASLEVCHAFVGSGGVAELALQPVEWKLIVDPDEPLDALDLYVVARAGHRLTVPTDELIASNPPSESVAASLGEPQVQSLNPHAVQVTSGTNAAWTIDPVLPLKVGLVRSYRPAESDAADAARIDVFPGGAASLVIAVDSGTPRLNDLAVASYLPADVQFKRLATIPVYDGPTVDGKPVGRLLEHRYEAMVPLDYTLDPESVDGVHLVAATVTPGHDTPPGVHRGKVTLQFAGKEMSIPVELHVAPIQLSPKRHFGALFGAIAFLASYEKGIAGMVEDSLSVADFHGLDDTGLSPKTFMSLSIPDNPDPRTQPTRELAEKYFHILLDNHLLPQSPALYAYFTYDVVDRGEGKAPELTNWDFTRGYDKAVEEFVIGRDMPWLVVGRTNGGLINRTTLNNGKTYSVDPNPGDPNWVQLSRDEYNRLVVGFWEPFAAHLEELGVLDRAMLVIDESGVESFDNLYAYVMAMKSAPHARQIKIGHTTHKTSVWTHRLPNGKLLMDEVLDVPMPENDEHFNFFEPEWASRFQRPGKSQWVYNVETDHITLENAGLSTVFIPLKLERQGVDGWYDWECVTWSMPYSYNKGDMGGSKYVLGPAINPWVNPFYHHGPGAISFFYPPDARGPAAAPTDLVIPSFRLTLMRDGIQQRALLEALQAGKDDQGQPLQVDAGQLEQISADLTPLWGDNPVQWYLDYHHYQEARRALVDAAMKSRTP